MKRKPAAPPTLHVATNGSDQWSGRLPSPDPQRLDGPFATLARAKQAVRERMGDGQWSGPLRVLIRGGRHELAEPLVFTPEDSGTDASPIIYAAYPGEQPSFSGGRIVTGWRSEELKGRSCWTTHLPEVAAGKWRFTQLFVNGKRKTRARLPKNGWYRFAGCQAPLANYAPGDLDPNWNWQDIDLVALQYWYESRLRVKRIDPETRTLHFVTPRGGDLKDEKGEYARYWVENVAEALSEPGEWCLDSRSGRLSYLPEPGEELGNVEIIAPRLEKLLLLEGRASGAKVRNLRFENLDFRHAEWRLPLEMLCGGQADFVVPGAIVFRAAENCALYGCAVSRVGQYAVEVQKGSRGNQIVACSLHDLGAGGVKINHEGPPTIGVDAFKGVDYAAEGWGKLEDGPVPGRDLTGGMRTVVSDCEIARGGQLFPSAVGIWIGDSGRNRIRHNHIHDFYYSGISCGWNWGNTQTHCMDNLIEHNHIHDIGQGLLSDMAGIYLLGRQPGTIVRGNHIHDVKIHGYGGAGLYNDGYGSSFVLLEGNLVHHVESAYFCNSGYGDILRDNILAMSDKTIEIANAVGLAVEGNVMLSAAPTAFNGYDAVRAAPKGNRYAFPLDACRLWNSFAPAAWLEQDIDRSARFIEPLFVNPDSGDFRVRPGSPLRGRKELFAWLKAGTRHAQRAELPASLDAWNRQMKDRPKFDRTLVEPWFDMKLEEVGHKSTLIMRSGQEERVKLELINRGERRAVGELEIKLPRSFVLVDGPPVAPYDLAPFSRMTTTWTVRARRLVMMPLMIAVKSRQGHFPPLLLHTLPETPPPEELERLALRSLAQNGKVLLSMGTAWYDSAKSVGQWLPGAGFLTSKHALDDRGMVPIQGTALPRLHQTGAFATPDNLSCRIPLPDGDYDVIFHFAETWVRAKGLRQFDIVIDGQPWQRGVDVFDLAGGAFKALALAKRQVHVDNGALNIELNAAKTGHQAILNGLELKRL